ncbi:hypothetical protein [Formosa algae]|uniref:Big-1 domain-containing protein n=1 Tax=Formosa algae TaxID=225843 RepID=A0A9X1CB70_9FLAO|nr:hypothetical protein [Formosa algae]MBP1838895.1 hypothetical protein [Formosa algae]MDQ0333672.1 hypothetical protein [Formosa algae]OEI78859.1 hypothetical protein AST99_16930 [Formosa algae]
MKKFLFLFLLILSVLFINCGEENTSENEPEVIEDTTKISISIDLPVELEDEVIIITTPNESFDATPTMEMYANITATNKEVIFAENSNGDILFASITTVEDNIILSNYSMAQTMVGLLPWTGLLENDELKEVLKEISYFEEFNQLVKRIEVVVKENKSPLDDEVSLTLLSTLNQKIVNSDSNGGKLENGKNLSIPDVNYLVEPTLTYSDTQLKIDNDGQTTATWGVEIINKDIETESDYFMLEGNSFHLPTVESLIKYFFLATDFDQILLDNNDPITYSITEGSTYQINFRSPTSLTVLDGKLAYDAALYNVYLMVESILNAFGFELPEMPSVNPSDFLNLKGCSKDLFSDIYNSSIEALSKDELDDEFIVDKVIKVMSTSIETIGECTEIGKKIKNTNYFKRLLKIINIYGKIGNVFKIGKHYGDMNALFDITICRQFIQGNMYSCFKLEKITEGSLESLIYCPDTEIELSVKTKLDTVIPNVNTYPINLEMTWEYKNKDGDLLTSTSKIDSEGLAKFEYTTLEDSDQVIKALIKNGETIIDEVEFNLKIDKEKTECLQNPIIGNWVAISYNDKTMGETTNESYNEKCDVYLNSYTLNSSNIDISEENILMYLNQTIYNIDYSTTDTNEIDCETIEKEPKTTNSSYNFILSEFIQQENTNIYKKITEYDDGQVSTLTIELLNENELRFLDQHKDIDNITRTGYSILYNRK